jgi:hypothetical protein
VSAPNRIISALTHVSGPVAAQVSTDFMAPGGGLIFNPADPGDQGLGSVAESLFVSLLGPPQTPKASSGVTEVRPGQTFIVPPYSASWVISASVRHRFTAFFLSLTPQLPSSPVPGDFPPSGPTGLLAVIPAYLYQQYTDDDDLQAFFAAYNSAQQDYVDTFNGLNLPIYTRSLIAGALCDWVITGIYGYRRPTLYVKHAGPLGLLNTWYPNQALAEPNAIWFPQPTDIVVASDDLYKRCLTWHVQKGDGRYFNVRWLKRRVSRFCYGVNGTCPPIDQTNQISVGFWPPETFGVTIRFVLNQRTVTRGCICNMFGPNGTGGASNVPVTPNLKFFNSAVNTIQSTLATFPPLPFMNEFAEGVATGTLELPFQFSFHVQIG